MISKYTKFLKELGLDENEAHIYLTLLQFGNAIAGTIIKETRLPRWTVYQVLDKLIEKNLVLKIDKDNILTYFPEDPERLLINIKKESTELNKKRDLAEKLVPHLNTLKNPYKNNPKVSYFEWEDAYYKLLDKSLEIKYWEILMITNSKYKKTNEKDAVKLETIYLYEELEFMKKRNKNNIKLRLITSESDIGKDFQFKDKNCNRETKILPPTFWEVETMVIFDNNLIIITDNYPIIWLHIEEEQFVTMMKNIFEFIWKSLK
jgi:sugar-specific transcriptional regulator TrmB